MLDVILEKIKPMQLLIRKKHIHRHRILKALQEYYDNHWMPDLGDVDVSLSFSELVEICKLSEKQVREQLPFLQRENEVGYLEINYSSYYYISNEGTISLYDKKHYSVGTKMFLEEIYDMVKNVSAILLLLIAMITFTINLIDTKNNKKEIQTLKTEIERIKKSNKK
jgi:hypothetical protein